MVLKTLLCCIGRLENQYIREFIEYYKNIGFTNICLFDNNMSDEEHFEDVISDYIDSGFVILKNYRDRKVCQLEAYQECYKTYSTSYDWIAFFDCDEFLELNEYKNIDNFLSDKKFDKYNIIHVNWKVLGDNNMVYNDGRPCYERFRNQDFKKTSENKHIKSIIRGNLSDIYWNYDPYMLLKTCGIKCIPTAHSPFSFLSACCDVEGNKINGNSPFSESSMDKGNVYLCHFSTKTAEEYCNKLKRGFPDCIFPESRFKSLVINNFFALNEFTEDKKKLFESTLNLSLF